MLKKLGIILCLTFIFGTFALAQDNPQTERQLEATSWNTVCPIDGNPVSPEITTVRYNGKEYGFDGSSCATVFSEDPGFYVSNLSEDGTQYIGKPKEQVPEK